MIVAYAKDALVETYLTSRPGGPLLQMVKHPDEALREDLLDWLAGRGSLRVYVSGWMPWDYTVTTPRFGGHFEVML